MIRAIPHALALGAQIANPPVSDAAADEPGPRFEKFSNGLRICVIEDHALPLVSVQLWFKVGSSFDPPTQPGLTHLAMCALQQASPADQAHNTAGEYHDAATLRDACYFHSAFNVDATPPDRTPDALDRALRRESERFARAWIDRATLKSAQGIAAERRRLGATNARMDQGPLLDAMFPAHPYRSPPEFVGDWARGANDTVLREHIERWFTPTNATLFIVGDVSTDATIAAVRKHFAGIEWRDTPRRADFDPPPDERLSPPSTQLKSPTEITLAWLTPPFGSFENAAIDVLMQRLCNSIDGPLPGVLARAGWGAATWDRQAWRNCGVLTISSRRSTTASGPSSAMGSAADLARLIDQELQRTADSTVEVVHLNRARSLAARGALQRRTGFIQRAVSLAEHEIIGGDVLLNEYEVPRYRHATAGDVAFAAKLLAATRRVIVGGNQKDATSQPAAPEASDWRLVEFAGDPALAASLTGWAARTRQERQIGPSATIELLPVAGAALAWISINRTGTAIDREALQNAINRPERADYLSYYAWQLAVGGPKWLLEVSGSVDRLDSLLELAIRDARESAAASDAPVEWRVRCIGGISMDELETAVRSAVEP